MKKTQITQVAENLGNMLIATRRDFHMHPELSGLEQRTSFGDRFLHALREILPLLWANNPL